MSAHSELARVRDLEAQIHKERMLTDEVTFNLLACTKRAEAAEAKLAECERDAVRYRWLRSRIRLIDSVVFAASWPYSDQEDEPARTDAAIDAASEARPT